MPTGVDVANAGCMFLGQRYSTDEGRTSPWSDWKDCSGEVAAAYQVAAGRLLGAYNTPGQWALCSEQGLAIPTEVARWIAGACPLIPDDPAQGDGDNGHIGIFLGDGRTVEATPPRVQILPGDYQPWGPWSILLPGVDYRNNGKGGIDIPSFEEDDMNPRTIIGVIGNPADFAYVLIDNETKTLYAIQDAEVYKAVASRIAIVVKMDSAKFDQFKTGWTLAF